MSRLLALAATIGLFVLYLSGLTAFGIAGTDETRYAAIGRAMAASGDWITPHLWGQPWFEKPALLYWLIGGAFRLGLGQELAPRLPIALLSIAFLLFYFVWLNREFSRFVAGTAACLLGASAFWIGFSHAAVTDLPLAVTFSAAILLLLPAVEGRPAPLNVAAVLLGFSVLAKGLVPLILFLPFFYYARPYRRQWLRPAPVLVFLAVTLPWYIACTVRNGPQFLEVFFWQHQLGRFTSGALQHVQPFWFYIPVLIGALFPSIFLAPFAFSRVIYHDRRRRYLAATVFFGFLFFSASTNKLPGYLLPLLPALCILIAAGIDAARRLAPKPLAIALAVSALLLPAFVMAAGMLPRALAFGLRQAWPIDIVIAGRVAATMPIVIIAAGAMLFLTRERGLILWFVLVFTGWLYIEYAALPWVDQAVSARGLWNGLKENRREACVGSVSRAWRYGLNYYSVTPLPECAQAPAARYKIVPGPTPQARPGIQTTG